MKIERGSIETPESAIADLASKGNGHGRHRSWGRPLVIACLLMIVLLPIILTPDLPLQDWPNHLARLYVLAHPDDPVLSGFYRVDWALRPNLAFDVVGIALAQAMPVESAGRAFLMLAVLVFATAPIALERALRGEIRGASLLALPIAFNLALQKGFLGFYLSAGLAVWAYALWIAADRPIRRMAAAHLSAAVLFVCHLYALGLFAILIGGHWLGERLAGRATGRSWIVGGVLSGSAFLLPAAVFLLTPTAEAVSQTRWLPWDIKIRGLVGALALVPTSGALTVVGLAFLPLILRMLGRQPVLDAAARVPVLILTALALVLPYWLMSSANADWRIVPPLALVIFGASDPGLATRRAQQTVVLLSAVLAFASALAAALLWSPASPVTAMFDQATERLPKGARVFPVILDEMPWTGRSLDFEHLPARLVSRGIFVPSLFAFPGQQPLRFAEHLEPLREPFGKVYYGETPPDWQGVASNFDCVVLMHTDYASMGTIPKLPIDAVPVWAEATTVVYRIGGEAVCGGFTGQD